MGAVFKPSLSQLIFALFGKCWLPFAHPSQQDGCNSSSPHFARVTRTRWDSCSALCPFPACSPNTCFKGHIIYFPHREWRERKKRKKERKPIGGKKKDISYSAGLGFFNPHSRMLESFFKIPDFQLLHPDKLHFTDSGYKQPIVVQLIFPLEIPHKSLTVLQPGQTPKIQQIKGKVLKLPRWVLL